MSNKATLEEFAARCREERGSLQKEFDNLEAGRTFLGSSSDPFGAASLAAHLGDLRRQIADLDNIISTHDANNGGLA